MLSKRQGLIVFAGLSIYASALNYFLYPFLGRILPSSQYVDITVALSLFTQIGTFMSALIAVTIGLSKSTIKDDNQTIEDIQSNLLRILIILSVIFVALSPFIMPAIHMPALYALPILLMLIISIPITIISGHLNGKNLLPQLGIVAAVTASLQFIIGILSAFATDSGLITMLCMAIAQITAIFVLYKILGKHSLPRLRTSLFHTTSDPAIRAIIQYTALASLAIMAINILQISDLLILQGVSSEGSQLYTDIYIVSRVVFFSGMILIWPFLGEITLNNHRKNVRSLLRLVCTFTLLGATIIGIASLLGPTLFDILFGRPSSVTDTLLILSLAILFKILYLIITAVCLFLIVIRSYAPLWIALCASLLTVAFLVLGPPEKSVMVLVILNAIALITTTVSIYWFMRTGSRQ